MFGFFARRCNFSAREIVGCRNPHARFISAWVPLDDLRYHYSVYSEQVLDHFRNPRNAGELPGATVSVQVTNPVCGDILKLAIRAESDCVAEARFLCRGCTTSIACASLLTELLTGSSLQEARSISAASLSEALGGLPPATFHGAQLAADALSLLLAKLSVP